MLRKKYLRTILFALLFLSLLAIVLWKGPDEGPHIHVLSIKWEALQSIEMTGAGKTFRLVYQDEQWWAEQGEKRVAADPKNVEMAVTPLLHLDANAELEQAAEDAESWARYGLTEPAHTIKITLQGGEETIIQSGDRTPLQDNFYVRLDGQRSIYLVSIFTLQPIFNWDLDDFKVPQESDEP